MTITDRIQSMYTHVENAYNSIEDISSDLGKDNLNIELAPSELEQTTYTGKNLLNTSNLSEQTINGITFTPVYNNGLLEYINANGTATNTCWYIITSSFSYEVDNYFFNANSTDDNLRLYSDISGYVTTTKIVNNATAISRNVTINVPNNTTLSNAKIYPMIAKSNTILDYEPYVGGTASPNPEYPQDIYTISGSNSVVVCGKNIAYTGWASDFVSRINNSSQAKLETYDGKNCLAFYPSVGNGEYDTKYLFKPIGGFKENTQYTFKIDKYSTSRFGDMDIVYTDGTVTEIQDLTANSWNSIVKTSIANKTIKYLKTRWRNNNWQYIDLDTFMVYEGTEDTTYEPYVSQTANINLPVENLFDKDNATILNAYIDQTNGITTSEKAKTTYIACKPNTTYTLSKRNDGNNNRFSIAKKTSVHTLNVSTSQ